MQFQWQDDIVKEKVIAEVEIRMQGKQLELEELYKKIQLEGFDSLMMQTKFSDFIYTCLNEFEGNPEKQSYFKSRYTPEQIEALIYQASEEKLKTKKLIKTLKDYQEKILESQERIIKDSKRIVRFIDRAAINYKQAFKVDDITDEKRIYKNQNMARTAIKDECEQVERKELILSVLDSAEKLKQQFMKDLDNKQMLLEYVRFNKEWLEQAQSYVDRFSTEN